MHKPIHILGTGLSHDGSACLLTDGQISVAIEKERLTRVKHDGFNDSAAIRYCLDAASIKFEDLSLVVQNANFSMFASGNDWFHGPRLLESSIPVVTISHHLAHCYSAIGTCPFDEAAVLVVDGCGSMLEDCSDLYTAMLAERPQGDLKALYFEKDSYYKFANGRAETLYKDFSPWGVGIREYPMSPNTTRHSVGGLYLAASMYVFNGFEDPGKLMGLAPFGRPDVFDISPFKLRQGRIFVDDEVLRSFSRPCRTTDQFRENFQYYADIARWMQTHIERALLYMVRDRYEKFPSKALCYAGGVALNAVANRRILLEGPFERLYIPSSAGDNGVAIGCAYYGWLQVLGKDRIAHDGGGSPYLGREYSREHVTQALVRHSHRAVVRRPPNIAHETATLLARGATVGWFQGRAEFGPRALGNRSILADPRRSDMQDHINLKIKQREDFRPFAPTVLECDVQTYFDCDYDSPYMLLVALVRPEWRDRIPAVVHRDGTARIQTVTRTSNPAFYDLIASFKAITGIGLLLNTSFNKRHMPIVETPEEAIDFYFDSGLDVLVLGDTIIQKRADCDCVIVPTAETPNDSVVR